MLYKKSKSVSKACIQFPQSIRHVVWLSGLWNPADRTEVADSYGSRTYTEAVGVLTLTTRPKGFGTSLNNLIGP